MQPCWLRLPQPKSKHMKGLSKYHLVKDTRLFRDGTSNTGNYQQLEECLEKPFQGLNMPTWQKSSEPVDKQLISMKIEGLQLATICQWPTNNVLDGSSP